MIKDFTGKYFFLNNKYKCSITFNQEKFNSVSEFYYKYKDKLSPDKLDQQMYIITALKFLQDKSLMSKLMDIQDEISGRQGVRLMNIKEYLNEMQKL